MDFFNRPDELLGLSMRHGVAANTSQCRSLPGNYNANGLVDAADYVLWRKYVVAPAGTLANDV